jgi:hypothetical protein
MRKAIFFILLLCLSAVSSPAAADPVKLWDRRVMEDINGSDDLFATDLTMDTAENIYVTGHTGDIITVKYDRHGNLQWSDTYSTPSTTDEPGAIAMDDSGHVFVAGKANYYLGLLKYSSDDGQRLDNKLYNNIPAGDPASIKMQIHNGFVYLGLNDNTNNCQILKVNAGNLNDYTPVTLSGKLLRDLILVDGKLFVLSEDQSGNQYYYLNVYDNNLQPLDSIVYPSGGDGVPRTGVSVASTDGSNIYVLGKKGISSAKDIEVIKYAFDGAQLIEQASTVLDEHDLGLYNPYAGSHYLNPIYAISYSGNLYTSGNFNVTNEDIHYLLLKVDSNLNLQWCRTYKDDVYTGDNNSLHGMALDNTGNIYLTGVMGENNNIRIDTLKYDSAGNRVWLATHTNPLTGQDVARSAGLAVNDSGDTLYVTGYERNSTGYNLLVLKYGNAITWDSYLDRDGTTAADSFASPNHIVYMLGEGFNQTANYVIAYYDGSGVKILTENKPAEGGTLTSQCDLQKGGQPGTWHAVVFEPGTPAPETYDAAASTGGYITEATFTVAEFAIPEFTGLFAGLAVATTCGVIYLLMRHRGRFSTVAHFKTVPDVTLKKNSFRLQTQSCISISLMHCYAAYSMCQSTEPSFSIRNRSRW